MESDYWDTKTTLQSHYAMLDYVSLNEYVKELSLLMAILNGEVESVVPILVNVSDVCLVL